MVLNRPGAEVFVPDGTSESQALSRTTHLGIGAHPDDLEFMTWHGILECIHRTDRWFSGVTITDGRGSSRAAAYADFSDEQMARVRRDEQRKAAFIGEYGALVTLGYSSAEVRGPERQEVGEVLEGLLRATRPRVLYTHSLCDRHTSHAAVATLVVDALRRLGPEYHPQEFYGCEVWRSLDWLVPEDRVCFDVSAHENLSSALMGVYDSQIAGGKRYDLATLGRRRANATYHDPYAPDHATLLEYAMDLGPLLRDSNLSTVDFAMGIVERLARDVRQRLQDFRE